MKKIIVTGATGLIGRYCIPLLTATGYSVCAVTSRPAPRNLTGEHWRRADLMDPAQVAELIQEERPTTLLHLAWVGTGPGRVSSADNIQWVRSSLHLLTTFAEHGGQRVVGIGSCLEYEDGHDSCSEHATPMRPQTLYGNCKHAVQILQSAFAQSRGLSAAWARVFLLYGPHENPNRLVADVIRSLLRGERARCSHGNQVRDFLHVEDVAAALVRLVDSDVTGPMNVGSGNGLTLKDLVCRIGGRIGREDLLEFGARPAAADEPRRLVADVSRLAGELDWRPRYDLNSGLDQTIAWWRNHLKDNGSERP